MSRPIPGTALAASLAVLLSACGGGGGISRGLPISTPDATAEIVFCRFKRDGPEAGHVMRVASRVGLANDRIRDRPGIERDARVHPDGNRVVFTRETNGETTRELFIARLDGSGPESRLTGDRDIDNAPCWSPDGTRVLFSSNRIGTGFRLWSISPTGNDLRVVNDDGKEQLDPDANSEIIVFSSYDANAADPRATLWLLDADSMTSMELTDGGAGTTDEGTPGDYEPAISPDGRHVVFTRSLSEDRRQLMRVDLATLIVEPLGDGAGSDRYPRWAPTGDALIVARRRPLEGINGLQLYELDLQGADPVAILPDDRFDHPGFDPLPNYPTRPSLGAPRRPDFSFVDAELAFGRGSSGSVEALESDDGLTIRVRTAPGDRREVGGLRVAIPLDVDDPTSIGRVTVTVRAALSRDDGDSMVRLTLYNTLEDRNDTVIQREVTGTGLETFTFSTQSLAHVSQDGAIVISVIADLPEGDSAELAVDSVTVTVRERT